MNEYCSVVCDRCGAEVEGFRTEYATGGFYDVRHGHGWASFAEDGESNVCDGCMLADPRYVAAYGGPTVCSRTRRGADFRSYHCIRAPHSAGEPCVWVLDPETRPESAEPFTGWIPPVGVGDE